MCSQRVSALLTWNLNSNNSENAHVTFSPAKNNKKTETWRKYLLLVWGLNDLLYIAHCTLSSTLSTVSQGEKASSHRRNWSHCRTQCAFQPVSCNTGTNTAGIRIHHWTVDALVAGWIDWLTGQKRSLAVTLMDKVSKNKVWILVWNVMQIFSLPQNSQSSCSPSTGGRHPDGYSNVTSDRPLALGE